MESQKREISVVGLGYIGLPTAVVLAQAGHHVKGYDVKKEVRERLAGGHIHIVENQLQEAFSAVHQSGALTITDTLETSDVYILCVPTPFLDGEEKRADLSYVQSAGKLVAGVRHTGIDGPALYDSDADEIAGRGERSADRSVLYGTLPGAGIAGADPL